MSKSRYKLIAGCTIDGKKIDISGGVVDLWEDWQESLPDVRVKM